MRDLLEKNLARFEELERQLVDPELLADSTKLTAAIREHGSLNRLATKYRRFKELNGEITEAREMAEGADADMRELAEAELPELIDAREELWNELLSLTLGGADANRTRCVMEIRGGTGGDEAALFARDLYEMYKRHAEVKRWKIEVLDHSATELGGFKEISLSLEGDGVYRELQYESGGHRVQRVPATETQGRIHTSAATVAVMPEPEDVEVNIKTEDYRLDKFCASGPGGQHVNKTESAVRLTHYETGIVVQCQDEKSQHKNIAKALRVLKARVYEVKREAEDKKRSEERKTLVGSGDRSQRIRTYNFPDNRVTDHRIGLTLYKLDQIIAGNLQPVTDALIEYDRQQLRDAFAAAD
ncbi:MAG: peptide chain release factor 1 [Pirellulales bacterium]|nr:peptide chain release factor 1 [Pirellulales bacterium]